MPDAEPLDTERYRVPPGGPFDLDAYDPQDRHGAPDKAKGKARVVRLGKRLDALQDLLYAERRHRLLVILQGMDTSGKDSTIRHVFSVMDPLGLRAVSFGPPGPEAQGRDYLWRIHRHVPANGQIVIFNRSHYEDVLIARVRGLVSEAGWHQRFDHIEDFERMLVEEGTTVRKFFLNISKDEQAERLRERLERPDKQWKFDPSDVSERQLWDEYRQAYADAIGRTSTEAAPWYVVPANRKWYRNLVVASVIVEALESLQMRYPPPAEGLDQVRID